MPEYKIKPIVLVITEADKSGFTYMAFAGTKMLLDVAVFLIEGTPNKSGRVVVDTGTYAASMAKYWPGKAEDVKSFEDALKEEGMTVDDVDIIIHTHLHHDHCVNTSKCRNADVYVQEEEWAFAMAPHPIQAQYYPKEIYEGWKLRLIRGDYELFPGLRILHTPGHTPGTQSLAVQTKRGTAVIPGMCSIYQTFQNPSKVLGENHSFGHWEVFSQAIATDMNQSYWSNYRLKSVADVLYPCHGPGFCDKKRTYVNMYVDM